MVYSYRITIDVWPHSTGAGQDVDQKACGPRRQAFEVPAEDIDKAVVIAKTLVAAIEANPRVWQAPIRSIEWLFR